MKTLKWNLGIFIIRIGYIIRDKCGKPIIRIGYKLRGDIPQKTWKWNHI